MTINPWLIYLASVTYEYILCLGFVHVLLGVFSRKIMFVIWMFLSIIIKLYKNIDWHRNKKMKLIKLFFFYNHKKEFTPDIKFGHWSNFNIVIINWTFMRSWLLHNCWNPYKELYVSVPLLDTINMDIFKWWYKHKLNLG